MLFKCAPIFFLPLVCFGQLSEPDISKCSPPQVKTVGDMANLECVLHYVNASEYPISWLKATDDTLNPHRLLSRNSRTIPDSRYTVAYMPSLANQGAGVFKFQISDLQESDSGTYLCNVHLSATTRLEGKMNLTVEPAAVERTLLNAKSTDSGANR